MKLLKEDKLEEKIPRDLAKANYIKRPSRRNTDEKQVDYENSTYETLDPATAFKMWHDGDYSNILVLVKDTYDQNHLVKFRDKGKVDVDYNFDIKKPFTNRNGAPVSDIKRMNIKHLFDVAEKIYLKNEVPYNKDKLDKNIRLNDYSDELRNTKQRYYGDNKLVTIGDFSGDKWFIPDTGAHSGEDGRPRKIYDMGDHPIGQSVARSKQGFVDAERRLDNRTELLNTWQNKKKRDRSLSMVDYLIAQNNGDKLLADLHSAKQKYRNQRIYSRDLSQISAFQSKRRQLWNLQDKLRDTEDALKTSEEELADVRDNRYTSNSYQDNKYEADRYKRRIEELKHDLEYYEGLLKKYEDALDDKNIDKDIADKTDGVNRLKQESDNIKAEIKNLIGKKTESLQLDESLFN